MPLCLNMIQIVFLLPLRLRILCFHFFDTNFFIRSGTSLRYLWYWALALCYFSDLSFQWSILSIHYTWRLLIYWRLLLLFRYYQLIVSVSNLRGLCLLFCILKYLGMMLKIFMLLIIYHVFRNLPVDVPYIFEFIDWFRGLNSGRGCNFLV